MNTVGLSMLLLSLLMKSMYTEITPVEPLCSDQETPHIKRCCSGHRTIAGKCHPCVGSYGLECSIRCTDGYYGEHCLKKCQCNTCNRITGECFYETTISNSTIKHPEDQNRSDIWIVILAGSLFLGSLVILLWILFLKKKRKTPTMERNVYLGVSGPTSVEDSQSYMQLSKYPHEYETASFIGDEEKQERGHYDNPVETKGAKSSGKSSTLSLLRRKANDSEIDKMDREYVDIIEIDEESQSTTQGTTVKQN